MEKQKEDSLTEEEQERNDKGAKKGRNTHRRGTEFIKCSEHD